MDERQSQVVAGAGLQDSRINEEFVAWLNKWGPRVIYLLLILVLGYLGLQYLEREREKRVDHAFAEYQGVPGNPEALLRVAEAHKGKAAVWTLATLDAADILLRSARTGIKPTAANPMAPTADDLYTEAERGQVLDRVAGLYADVIKHNESKGDRTTYVLNATWGLASAQLSVTDGNPKARSTMERFVELADKNGFPEEAAVGRNRLAVIDRLTQSGQIKVPYSQELPLAMRQGTPVRQTLPSGEITLTPGGVMQQGDGQVNLNRVNMNPTDTVPDNSVTPVPGSPTNDDPVPPADDPVPPADDPE